MITILFKIVNCLQIRHVVCRPLVIISANKKILQIRHFVISRHVNNDVTKAVFTTVDYQSGPLLEVIQEILKSKPRSICMEIYQ